jgi:site-specific recombinase XerD
MFAALRGAFDWAIGMNYYKEVHPFNGIVIPKITRKLPKVFSDDELANVFNAITNTKYKLFFSLMYYCGLRIKEVRTLRKDALKKHKDDYGLLIQGKGDVQRFVPVPDFIANTLSSFMLEHPFGEYVFYNESYKNSHHKPMSDAYAYEVFQKIKEQVNLSDNARPHSFRSTSATKMHRATGDLAQTQKFLGHARPETTMIYVQIADEQLQEASKAAFAAL